MEEKKEVKSKQFFNFLNFRKRRRQKELLKKLDAEATKLLEERAEKRKKEKEEIQKRIKEVYDKAKEWKANYEVGGYISANMIKNRSNLQWPEIEKTLSQFSAFGFLIKIKTATQAKFYIETKPELLINSLNIKYDELSQNMAFVLELIEVIKQN